MKPEDKKKFGELMALMGETFQKEVSKPQMRLYWTLLERFEYAEVERGIMHILETRCITGTIPVPAEIIQAIGTGSGVLSVEDRAELGWTSLIWAIEHVGHWPSVMFDDPVIHDVVQALGGWLKIQDADNPEWNHEKQLQWRRKDFVAMYKILAKQKSASPYLAGEQELSNQGKYDAFVPPRLIRITGQPGQYLALPHERPKELTGTEDTQFIAALAHRLSRPELCGSEIREQT